jgi:hypothetical protein
MANAATRITGLQTTTIGENDAGRKDWNVSSLRTRKRGFFDRKLSCFANNRRP